MISPNRLIVPATLSALLAAGCSSAGEGASQQAEASSRPAASANIGALSVKFTDLGGGSPIVKVYADPSEAGRSKPDVGTYNNGDVEPIVCYTVGREIISAAGAKIGSPTDLGEAPLRSNVWYRLVRDGVFASDTYADIVPVGAVVPPCNAAVAEAAPTVVATTPQR